jgi:hypothetical protein
MRSCPIFSESEIETRSNTIGSASRKITTVSTLDVAVKPFNKKLLELEKNSRTKYNDLVEFMSGFWQEWANNFPEFQPTASGAARQQLRKTSFAMSNIMFFPLFRMAFEFWQEFDKTNTDWRNTKEWQDAIAKLTQHVEVEVPDPAKVNARKTVKVPIMARESDSSVGNPEWRGKILVESFNSEGKSVGWNVSSTRQTRDSAYYYLLEKAGRKSTSKKAAIA